MNGEAFVATIEDFPSGVAGLEYFAVNESSTRWITRIVPVRIPNPRSVQGRAAHPLLYASAATGVTDLMFASSLTDSHGLRFSTSL